MFLNVTTCEETSSLSRTMLLLHGGEDGLPPFSILSTKLRKIQSLSVRERGLKQTNKQTIRNLTTTK